MTSIERTAYPRFSNKQQFNKQWLFENFCLTEEDHLIIKMKRDTSDQNKLCMAVQLKIFQYLGYFLDTNSIPGAIIKTVRNSLGFKNSIKVKYQNDKTKYRHRNYIREKLNVVKWKDTPESELLNTQRLAIKFTYDISQTMNNPADILNATLEYMRSSNYELPAFSTIDRLIRHVRHTVNTKIFKTIYHKIKGSLLISKINNILQFTDKYNRSDFNKLKSLPCSPTISNINKLILHYNWLTNLGNIDQITKDISYIKLTQFAEYAGSLDVSDIREMSKIKRYALTTILIGHLSIGIEN